MDYRVFKYIKMAFVLGVGLLLPTFVSAGISCTDEASGLTYAQHNPDNAPWKCPEIDAAMSATLTDVDLESGVYSCRYAFTADLADATTCDYLSQDYKDHVDTRLQEVTENLQKVIIDGINFEPFATLPTQENFYNKLIMKDSIDRVTSVHLVPVLERQDKLVSELSDTVDEKLTYLRENYYKKVMEPHVDGYLINLTGLGDELANAHLTSYKSFVEPYVKAGAGDTREKKTFSRFITGMVTLDPEVIHGYNEEDGKLQIAQGWKGINATILNLYKEYFGDKNSHADTLNTDTNSVKNVNNWLQIFQQKIWGFYYNLQRRLDIGYDIIATQLLFIMMAFFAMSATARGAARYITNRENGQSSGEVKINEANIMKTLGILATVFVFYISVPSVKDSTYVATQEIDVPHEMKGNNSLVKGFIRYAMKEGAYFGTMISDLGTDAFLHFLIHKQGLNNGLKERNNIIRSIREMVYYFPSLQIANECRLQTPVPDDKLLLGRNLGIDPEYRKGKYSKFPEDNAIVEIDNKLCARMLQRSIPQLENLSDDVEHLIEILEKDWQIRLKATSALVKNHIALQIELGWMNIAAVPYTYFMMKNQKLFFESSLDIKKIKEKTRDYRKNIGLRGGVASANQASWMKADYDETVSRINNANSQAKFDQKQYTRLAVYNFLPGFVSIRNEILQRIQSLYSDTLRIAQRPKSKNGETTPPNINNFKKFLTELLSGAGKFYYDDYENSPYSIAQLTTEINALKANQPVELHKKFIVVSYMVAMSIWKSGFAIIFLAAIAMIIGIKIVLFVISVMVHFFISPFIVLWAFATSTDGGMSKIKNYLRDTLIYMLYPSIIVIGVFVFIFAYELFYSIYGFITSMLIEGQIDAVSNAVGIAPLGEDHDKKALEARAELSFLSVYALRDITEILIDLLSVYVAFMTINKFPELVLKMMGLGDSAIIMLPQANEAIQNKGGGSVNPLSR